VARIAMALGGRSAEELSFGEITTGAADDIRRATQIARMMVCEVGMSEKLGPVSYGEREESIFLGREFAQHRPDYSDKTAIDIDDEIKRIVEEQHQRALGILKERRETLDRVAHALLERETLDHEEIMALIEGRELPKRERVIIPTWAERAQQSKDKRRGASIFGSPKPATSG
jgi:cell division protease FtsH